MNDIPEEELDDLVPIRKAGETFPGKPGYECIRRWCVEGLYPMGEQFRITLEHERIGKRLFITLKSYNRFMRRLKGNQNEKG